ncbi:hypothetical protein [Microbulbifer taiwanensis]|uniref:hypothetical protein n=1 Tax=Microbulbifer taiwanensis TaxID=986746 RepID=UPI00360914AF
MNLSVIDLVVICVYVLVLAAVALHVSRERTGHEKSTNDYFLAGNSLPGGLLALP